MGVCADTSFLVSLYGNDVHGARAVKWIARSTVPIHIGVLTRYELGNALRFSEFRRQMKPGKATQFLAFDAHQKKLAQSEGLKAPL